jgi:hypothetical protein
METVSQSQRSVSSVSSIREAGGPFLLFYIVQFPELMDSGKLFCWLF